MRLPKLPRPERYDLSLHVDPAKPRFHGELAVALELGADTRALELHAVELEVDASEVEDASGVVKVARVRANPERETVSFVLERPLVPGKAELRVRYSGPLRTDLRGLYLARSGKRRYAATQLEAADARRFFPCFDEPEFKARFRLRVTTPARNRAVSNGALQRSERRGARVTHHFAETPPLSTYLVALVVGELEASRPVRCGSTPIRVWCVPGKKKLAGFALRCAVESLRRLEAYFGLPYPYGKLDLIAVPDFEFGAMENAGAVTFRETLLLVDEKTVSLAEKKRVAEVIAHELAHMWYGDLVTMAWWDDLWLNEAFATWMAFKVVDDWKPEWDMWLDFESHRAPAFALDALENTHPIYVAVESPSEATENFDVITYEKGASVVRMLESWLGPAVFRAGVRRYVRRHREANARAADLWRALEESAKRPITAVVEPWLERPGFPLVAARRVDRGGQAFLVAEQERFFANPKVDAGARLETRPIPLVVRVRRGRGKDPLVRALAEQSSTEIPLGPSGEVRWAYLNAGEASFVRALHDAPLLRALGQEFARLAPVERTGLLGHQWAGARAGTARLADWLELVARLGAEREPEVLGAASGGLSWLVDQLLPPLGERGAAVFRAWLAGVFAPEFAALGWQAERDESEKRRQQRAVLLGLLGGLAEQREALEGAAARIGPYLKSRAKLEANLAGPVVELAARGGDADLFDAYLRAMRGAATPQERTRFELALGSFRAAPLVERALALALTDEIPTQDVVPLLVRMLGNPAARERTWEFVRERWKDLSGRVSPGLAGRLVAALPALQKPLYKRQVAAFFAAHPLPTAARALRQALERFDLDAELRERALPELRAYLHNLV
ncbi:MAG TPA: M1 family metallopeptidase [Myxococcota bacterium]|nr:M1 family metallopeptidase [Myxococcota bacterium]